MFHRDNALLNTCIITISSERFEILVFLQVLQWSFELGIPEITVYAFSIENFKRTEEEVKTLMTLFKEKLDKLYEER